ncbi:MAG: 30S ribosomal protein S18 [Anaerolineae bacterium]|nr:30S ribosomal protein S18 [Anaerolineae bacterium]
MSDNDNYRRRDADGDDDFDGGRGDRDDRHDRGPRRGGRMGRSRHQQYCPDGKCFDYKDVDTLRRYVGETGKIKPRRQTGNCARCQRELAREVKRARHLALLPFIISSD